MRRGQQEGDQGATFNFGREGIGKQPGRIDFVFPRGSGSNLAMLWDIRGSFQRDAKYGPMLAHGAGQCPSTTITSTSSTTTTSSTATTSPSLLRKQSECAVMVYAVKIDKSASEAFKFFDEHVPNKAAFKHTMQDIYDTAQKEWPHFALVAEILRKEKGYVAIGIEKSKDPANPNLLRLSIAKTCTNGLKTRLNAKLKEAGLPELLHTGEISCDFLCPQLSKMINDPLHHDQTRFHFYDEDGGYMRMHVDHASYSSNTFAKCSYMEVGVGPSFSSSSSSSSSSASSSSSSSPPLSST